MKTEYKLSAASVIATVGALLVAVPAHAAVLLADGSNLRSVFAAANSGDTIRVSGAVGPMTLQNRTFSKTVTLDAQNATFTDSITMTNVSNMYILGGTFGSTTSPMRTGAALSLYGGSGITLSKVKFTGDGTGVGLRMGGTTRTVVSAGMFTNFRAGMGITSSNDVRLSSNRFIGMTSDGIDIADSHRVTATTNWCYAGNPSVGAHPDCIQLWSIAGNPILSDITLTKTNIKGDTQGLTLFDGGGVRITITDNIIATSYPQGIACIECSDSIITGNKVTTIPGSRWRTSINVVGGTNNIVSNNSVGPLTAARLASFAAFSPSGGALSFAGAAASSSADNGSDLDQDPGSEDAIDVAADPIPDFILEDFTMAQQLLADGVPIGPDSGDPDTQSSLTTLAVAAVPEPALWAQLILGFGLIGAARRRAGQLGVA